MRLFKSKKGDAVEESNLTVIGLIVGTFLVVFIISFGLKFMSEDVDEGTGVQFDKIAEAIEIMAHPDNTEKACKLEIGYIMPGMAIVGFNYKGEPNNAGEYGDIGEEDYGYVEEFCGAVDDNIYRPKSCLNRACLCLCDPVGDVDGDDCYDGTCRIFEKEVLRLSGYDYDDDKSKTDLVLYGESCNLGFNHDIFAGFLIREISEGHFEVIPEFNLEAFASYEMSRCSDIVDKIKPKIKKEDLVEEKKVVSGDSVNDALEDQKKAKAAISGSY